MQFFKPIMLILVFLFLFDHGFTSDNKNDNNLKESFINNNNNPNDPNEKNENDHPTIEMSKQSNSIENNKNENQNNNKNDKIESENPDYEYLLKLMNNEDPNNAEKKKQLMKEIKLQMHILDVALNDHGLTDEQFVDALMKEVKNPNPGEACQCCYNRYNTNALAVIDKANISVINCYNRKNPPKVCIGCGFKFTYDFDKIDNKLVVTFNGETRKVKALLHSMVQSNFAQSKNGERWKDNTIVWQIVASLSAFVASLLLQIESGSFEGKKNVLQLLTTSHHALTALVNLVYMIYRYCPLKKGSKPIGWRLRNHGVGAQLSVASVSIVLYAAGQTTSASSISISMAVLLVFLKWAGAHTKFGYDRLINIFGEIYPVSVLVGFDPKDIINKYASMFSTPILKRLFQMILMFLFGASSKLLSQYYSDPEAVKDICLLLQAANVECGFSMWGSFYIFTSGIGALLYSIFKLKNAGSVLSIHFIEQAIFMLTFSTMESITAYEKLMTIFTCGFVSLNSAVVGLNLVGGNKELKEEFDLLHEE